MIINKARILFILLTFPFSGTGQQNTAAGTKLNKQAALSAESATKVPDYFEISKNLDIFNAVYRELNISYVDGTAARGSDELRGAVVARGPVTRARTFIGRHDPKALACSATSALRGR